jgi:L-amino acid N-acyltransferase YncA
MIRPVSRQDAERIASIYNHYVEHTIITFEEDLVPVPEMADRIERVTSAYPWLVLEQDGEVSGYAYATRWRERASYRLSAESTVYLAPDRTGQGMGTALYTVLIDRLREAGLHCVMGGIALPNAASVALHEKLGFRKVAELKEVGRKFDAWIDVGYWQLVL